MILHSIEKYCFSLFILLVFLLSLQLNVKTPKAHNGLTRDKTSTRSLHSDRVQVRRAQLNFNLPY